MKSKTAKEQLEEEEMDIPEEDFCPETEFTQPKVPQPDFNDVIVKIMQVDDSVDELSHNVEQAIEAIRELGKMQIATINELKEQMATLNTAFIKTVAGLAKQATTESKYVPPEKMNYPQPTAQSGQFDPADLMNHSWKKGKRKPDKTYDVGSLAYGWDFKDQFKPETVDALTKGPIAIDQYVIVLKGNFVSTKKAQN